MPRHNAVNCYVMGRFYTVDMQIGLHGFMSGKKNQICTEGKVLQSFAEIIEIVSS